MKEDTSFKAKILFACLPGYKDVNVSQRIKKIAYHRK